MEDGNSSAPVNASDRSKKKRSNLLVSILGAAFGVQSSKVQERDFEQRSAWPFIIGGLVFGLIFVLTLVFVVKAVLANA